MDSDRAEPPNPGGLPTKNAGRVDEYIRFSPEQVDRYAAGRAPRRTNNPES